MRHVLLLWTALSLACAVAFGQSGRDAKPSTAASDGGGASSSDGGVPPRSPARDDEISCTFDAGVLLPFLVDRQCVASKDCDVFRPRTAFEAFGCCLPVSRVALANAWRSEAFTTSFREAREACGHLKVFCDYRCDAVVCDQGTCRLLLNDGGVYLE